MSLKIKFLGQVLGEEGIQPDPNKIAAIQKMKEPQNISDLRRFLGMVNQLSKFSPQLAEKTKPLRDLLSTKNQWLWGSSQQQALQTIKDELSSSRILALYDAKRNTCVSADASSYGLGAVLMQQQPTGEWKPIAYIS